MNPAEALMGRGLRVLNRVSASPLIDRLHLRKPAERLLFLTYARDPNAVRHLMANLAQSGSFTIGDRELEQIRHEFGSGATDEAETAFTIRQTLAQIAQGIQAKGGQLAETLLSSAMSLVSAVIFIVVVPVVAFYMLLDWDHMVERLDHLAVPMPVEPRVPTDAEPEPLESVPSRIPSPGRTSAIERSAWYAVAWATQKPAAASSATSAGTLRTAAAGTTRTRPRI